MNKTVRMISSKRKKELQKLLKKYQQGKATQEEKEFVEKYYQYFDKEERITTSMNADEKAIIENRLLQKIRGIIKEDEEKLIPFYRRTFLRISGVAASVLVIVGLGIYFLFFNKIEKPNSIAAKPSADVEAPKSTKALITLADGRTVTVDSVISGLVAQQSDVTITKTEDGKIIYAGNADRVLYNTLTNPKGSKVIDVQLADGSHVWLNAGSSVSYPIAFIGNERKVEITGEAYFEVVHNAAKPFYVTKGTMHVQVLGTHFNVNAYDDENDIKVTLLEGSVKVSKNNNEDFLKPGQQAQVTESVKVISHVDVEQVMAWKNSQFKFNDANLETVMREISRWYDIDISYQSKPSMQFGGKMNRNSTLMQVLEILKASGVRFKLQDKTLIVL